MRLYRESDPKPVIRRSAEQLGVHHEALRNWIRQQRPTSVTTGRPARWPRRSCRLRRGATELRRANEILRAASASFATELDPTGR
ncbi:transposase [Micromonospora chersina]